MSTRQIHTPPRPRTQQAWELEPTAASHRIPPPPAGTRFVQVLPNQVWRAAGDEGELARFTGVSL